MAKRAVVAYPSEGSDTYDLHYSHNGADGLHVKHVLDAYLEGQLPDKTGGGMPPLPRDIDSELEQYRSEIPSELRDLVDPGEELIESEPLARDVPLDAVGERISFVNFEAVFVVRDWRVETYVPVWSYPDVLSLVSERMTYAVYEFGDEGPPKPSRVDEWVDSNQPAASFNMGSITPTSLLEEEKLFEYFVRSHEYAISAYKQATEQMQGRSELPSKSRVVTDELLIDVIPFGSSGPIPDAGRGMFVAVEPSGEEKLLDEYESIRSKSAEWRTEAGIAILADGATVKSAETQFAKQVFKRFNVATFSPDPFGELAKRLAEDGE